MQLVIVYGTIKSMCAVTHQIKEKKQVEEKLNENCDDFPTADINLQKPKKLKLILNIVLGTIMTLVAVLGGWVVGDMIINKIDAFDPTGYSAKDYMEKEENIALWKTKSIALLTPTQIFCVAEYNLKNTENYSVYTKGYDGEERGKVVAAGMAQDLFGYRYKYNGKGYFDYYSTGMKQVIKKTEFTFGEDKFYCYEGTGVEDTQWKLFPSSSGQDYRTAQEYEEMVGCSADNPIDYIVSSKTVLSESSNGKTNGLYSFTIKLDNKYSVLNYVKKMNYMSGFGYPKFTSLELRFEVDENMNFQNIYINESYKINVGLTVQATGLYKNEFHYDNIEIR